IKIGSEFPIGIKRSRLRTLRFVRRPAHRRTIDRGILAPAGRSDKVILDPTGGYHGGHRPMPEPPVREAFPRVRGSAWPPGPLSPVPDCRVRPVKAVLGSVAVSAQAARMLAAGISRPLGCAGRTSGRCPAGARLSGGSLAAVAPMIPAKGPHLAS